MLTTGSDAIAVVDGENRMQGVVTREAVLAWVVAGGGRAEEPIAGLVREFPAAVGSAATITDAVLAIAEAGADALAVTSDGSANGRLHRLVTSADIGRAFGDQPTAILRGIRLASTTAELRELNHRARALALQYLTSASSVDWLARFLSLADKHIVQRLIALAGDEPRSACWCFCGASGRAESLTRHAPQLVLIVEDDGPADVRDRFERVSDTLAECDYLSRADGAFERSFPARAGSRAEPSGGTGIRNGCVTQSAARCTWPARCSICGQWTAPDATTMTRCGGRSKRRSSPESTATSCRCWPTIAWPACRRSPSSKTL